MTDIITYLRVSTQAQEDADTIEAQRRAIAEWCDRNGYTIAAEFADNGVSGAIPLRERAQGRAMLAALKIGSVRNVVMLCPDRLGRDAVHAKLALEEFKRIKVDVHFVSQTFDNTAAGKLQMGILLEFAEYEKALIRERTMRGIRRNIEDKTLHWGKPHGYRKVNGLLEIREDEAEVVRRIFEFYIGGWGFRKIAVALTEAHVPPPAGDRGYTIAKDKDGIPITRTVDEGTDKERQVQVRNRHGHGNWNASAVQTILKNKVYAGLPVKFKTGDRTFDMTAPAIIDMGTWNKANALLGTRGVDGARAANSEYILGGILWCGLCGSRMSMWAGRGRYRCNNMANNAYKVDGDGGHYVKAAHSGYRWHQSATALENAVKAMVESVFTGDPFTLRFSVEKYLGGVQRDEAGKLDIVRGLEDEAAKLAARLAQVNEMAMAGYFRDMAETLAARRAVEADQRALDKKLTAARKQAAGIGDKVEWLTAVRAHYLRQMVDGNATDENDPVWRAPRNNLEWRHVIRFLWNRITVRYCGPVVDVADAPDDAFVVDRCADVCTGHLSYRGLPTGPAPDSIGAYIKTCQRR